MSTSMPLLRHHNGLDRDQETDDFITDLQKDATAGYMWALQPPANAKIMNPESVGILAI